MYLKKPTGCLLFNPKLRDNWKQSHCTHSSTVQLHDRIVKSQGIQSVHWLRAFGLGNNSISSRTKDLLSLNTDQDTKSKRGHSCCQGAKKPLQSCKPFKSLSQRPELSVPAEDTLPQASHKKGGGHPDSLGMPHVPNRWFFFPISISRAVHSTPQVLSHELYMNNVGDSCR